jgi:hypothetical protein
MICQGCGYVLDGLPAPRCPECGRGFDPADPRTFRLPGKRARPGLVFLLAVGVGAAITLVVCLAGNRLGLYGWLLQGVPAVAASIALGRTQRKAKHVAISVAGLSVGLYAIPATAIAIVLWCENSRSGSSGGFGFFNIDLGRLAWVVLVAGFCLSLAAWAVLSLAASVGRAAWRR